MEIMVTDDDFSEHCGVNFLYQLEKKKKIAVDFGFEFFEPLALPDRLAIAYKMQTRLKHSAHKVKTQYLQI